MRSLVFDQLLVRSNSQKKANQFRFSPTLNLITANDNSVGKTTLVKLLYWTFGCEVFFDTTWMNNDCESLVKFHVDDYNYLVARYKNTILLRNESGEQTYYDKITGNYSEAIAKILGFELLLPNRNNGKLEVPPPAYYFLPYYIDQKRSWSQALDNFGDLGQYSSWQTNTLKYHVGLIDDRFFEIERTIVGKKEKKNEHQSKVDKFEAAIGVVESIIPKNELFIDSNQFENASKALESTVLKLAKEQEECLASISDIDDEITFLENQRNILKAMASALLADYQFAVENVPADTIECPLCGVVHDNSIASRASILKDNDKVNQELLSIESKSSRLQNKKGLVNERIGRIASELADLDEKIRATTSASSFESFIHGVASNTVQNKVQTEISAELVEIHAIAEEIKGKQKEQRNLLPKKEKESIYRNFLRYFTLYLTKLAAPNINLAEVAGPMDYPIIQREGGAADGSRAMLAYYLAIYSSIKEKPNTYIGPLTIDTPNQHEQSHINYSKIVTVISENIVSPDFQVFLCAMSNPEISILEKQAKVFHLDENKLLASEKFDLVCGEFNNLGLLPMLASEVSNER